MILDLLMIFAMKKTYSKTKRHRLLFIKSILRSGSSIPTLGRASRALASDVFLAANRSLAELKGLRPSRAAGAFLMAHEAFHGRSKLETAVKAYETGRFQSGTCS